MKDNTVEKYLTKSAASLKKLIESDKKSIYCAAHKINEAFKIGNKILICGNGGSAADAQHFAAELVGRFKEDRISLPALALNTDTSAITAIGNDYDFSKIFSRQIEGIGKKNDILFCISTSGKSMNVINAAVIAKKINMKVISLTGDFESKLSNLSDVCIKASSKETCHIQELHTVLIHILCVLIEEKIPK